MVIESWWDDEVSRKPLWSEVNPVTTGVMNCGLIRVSYPWLTDTINDGVHWWHITSSETLKINDLSLIGRGIGLVFPLLWV